MSLPTAEERTNARSIAATLGPLLREGKWARAADMLDTHAGVVLNVPAKERAEAVEALRAVVKSKAAAVNAVGVVEHLLRQLGEEPPCPHCGRADEE